MKMMSFSCFIAYLVYAILVLEYLCQFEVNSQKKMSILVYFMRILSNSQESPVSIAYWVKAYK